MIQIFKTGITIFELIVWMVRLVSVSQFLQFVQAFRYGLNLLLGTILDDLELLAVRYQVLMINLLG